MNMKPLFEKMFSPIWQQNRQVFWRGSLANINNSVIMLNYMLTWGRGHKPMLPDTPADDSSMFGEIFQLTVQLYRDGCIEFDAESNKFISCTDCTTCALRPGSPCVWQEWTGEMANRLNDLLSKKRYFLLLYPGEAREVMVLIARGLLRYDPSPMQNRRSYYLVKKAQQPKNFGPVLQLNDALAILIAQGWNSDYSPRVLLPILMRIAAQ